MGKCCRGVRVLSCGRVGVCVRQQRPQAPHVVQHFINHLIQHFIQHFIHHLIQHLFPAPLLTCRSQTSGSHAYP